MGKGKHAGESVDVQNDVQGAVMQTKRGRYAASTEVSASENAAQWQPDFHHQAAKEAQMREEAYKELAAAQQRIQAQTERTNTFTGTSPQSFAERVRASQQSANSSIQR